MQSSECKGQVEATDLDVGSNIKAKLIPSRTFMFLNRARRKTFGKRWRLFEWRCIEKWHCLC